MAYIRLVIGARQQGLLEDYGKQRKRDIRKGKKGGGERGMIQPYGQMLRPSDQSVNKGGALFKAGYKVAPTTCGIVWLTLTNKNTIKCVKKQIHFILRLSLYLGCF